MMARVLVVEDVPANRALVIKLLRAAGHEVLDAEDVATSLELARERHPDVILMDLSLPEVDGWEALRRIRADSMISACPVVALTAHAMASDRERAMSAGFDGYMIKPIDAATFVQTVMSFVR
jgi:two-component system, cell cycle response regulator DivK